MSPKMQAQRQDNYVLVDNYLLEVGAHLPNAQRADILRELRESLIEEVETEYEGQTSAQSTIEQSQELVLKRLGHPLKVASEYAETQFVIGPRLYPAFIYTVKVVSGLLLAVVFAASLLTGAISDWTTGLLDVLITGVEVVFWGVAVVFGIFWSIEYTGERLRWYEEWQPSRLGHGAVGVVNRGEVITDMVSTGAFLLWWNDIVVLRDLIPVSEGQFTLALGSVWAPYFWPLNILFVLSFVVYVMVLTRGVWMRWQAVADLVLVIGILAIGLVLALLASGTDGVPLLVANIGPEFVMGSDGSSHEIMQENVSRVALVGLFVFCAILVKDLVVSLRRLQTMRHLRSVVLS